MPSNLSTYGISMLTVLIGAAFGGSEIATA